MMNVLKRTIDETQAMLDGIHRRKSSVDRKIQTDKEVTSYIINAIEKPASKDTEYNLTMEIS